MMAGGNSGSVGTVYNAPFYCLSLFISFFFTQFFCTVLAGGTWKMKQRKCSVCSSCCTVAGIIQKQTFISVEDTW